MSRKYLLLVFLLVFILGGLIYFIFPTDKVLAPVVNNNQNQVIVPIEDKSDFIKVTQPLAQSIISSPLEIRGEARGTWFFEGSFPIFITDDNGLLIAQGIATSTKDWMTEDFIPFAATIYFERPQTANGKVIFKKDNPSGLAQNDDQLIWPIKFDQSNMMVKVFFTTPSTGSDSDLDCKQLVAVEKTVPKSLSVARVSLEQLLKGPSAQDKAQGFGTSLNPNIKINSLTIESGIARVDFNEQLEYQVGGSCRVATINEQIVQTLKQFASVQTVIISINGRSQDILQP